MSKIVVALGGNALGNNVIEQKNIVKDTAKFMVDIIENNHELLIVHGNGPQIGMINNAFDLSSKKDKNISEMPFPECGAMSQAYIGYHLQNAILNELLKRKIKKDVVSIVTQVEVDKNDLAFLTPTKPIGSFFTEKEAKEISEKNNFIFKEDSGRGWRRVVPSPKPINIIEKEIIKDLFDKKHIVISVGGGGIPVIFDNNEYIGIPAVIDKDFASFKLAEIIDADILMILTAVDKVCINYNKPNEKKLDILTLKEIKKYIEDNQFAPGSMLPKIQAAMEFVKLNKNKKSIITKLSNASNALNNELDGTKIIL